MGGQLNMVMLTNQQVQAGVRSSTCRPEHPPILRVDFSWCWIGAIIRHTIHPLASMPNIGQVPPPEAQVPPLGRESVVPSSGRLCHAVLHHLPRYRSLR